MNNEKEFEDFAVNGARVLNIHGPDARGCYAGVLLDNGILVPCVWDSTGTCSAPSYCLIEIIDAEIVDEPAAPKEWQDVTQNGTKILYRVGPDSHGFYAGVLQTAGYLFGFEWDASGQCVGQDLETGFNLVPKAPEVRYQTSYVQEMLEVAGSLKNASSARRLKLGFVDGKLVSAEVIND